MKRTLAMLSLALVLGAPVFAQDAEHREGGLPADGRLAHRGHPSG